MIPVLRYFAGFAWGFVLLFSFAGWGFVLGRILRDGEVEWGRAISRGIALMVVVGGVLNLFHWISVPLVLGLVVVGLVATAALAPGGLRLRAMPRDPFGWTVAAAVLLAYGNWLYFLAPSREIPNYGGYSLNPTDDYHAYAVFPLRMLQTGWIGDDPFNERRSISGLGGESFLQTFVASVLPLEYLHVIDPGVAILAMAVMIHALVRDRRVAGVLTILFLSLPTEMTNASTIIIPVVLLMAIYQELARHDADSHLGRFAFSVALPLAAILPLKSTLVPGALAIVALERLFTAISHRRLVRPLVGGVMIGGLAILFLFPWMISSYISAGTLFYPFLGEGYRAFSDFAIPYKQPSRAWTSFLNDVLAFCRTPRIAACFAFALAAVFLPRLATRRSERRAAYLACLGGSMASLGIFMKVFTPFEFYRYCYPFVALILILSFAHFHEEYDEGEKNEAVPKRGRGVIRAIAWLGLVGLILVGGKRNLRNSRPWPQVFRSAVTGRDRIRPEEAAAYLHVQDTLPRTATILAFLSKPFLLDFRKNSVFVLDMPGAISPPPGLPLSGNSEAMADYLRGKGISYLACTPAYASPSSVAPAHTLKVHNMWLYSLGTNTALFANKLSDLVSQYRHVRVDDTIIMIDLNERLLTTAKRSAHEGARAIRVSE